MTNYESKTVKELKEIAQKKGIKKYTTYKTKDELITLLYKAINFSEFARINLSDNSKNLAYKLQRSGRISIPKRMHPYDWEDWCNIHIGTTF